MNPVQLDQNALALPEQARGIAIVDQLSFDAAARKLRDAVTIRKAITEHYAPMKATAMAAHRAACEAERGMLAPVLAAEQTLKAAIGAYEQKCLAAQREQERIAREHADAAAAAERERQLAAAREQAERQVEQLKAEATSKQELRVIEKQADTIVASAVEQARSEPMPAVRYEVEPQIYKHRGVSTSATFAAEVVSIKELCQAVADGSVPAEFVTPNMSALNRVMKATRGTMQIPGVRAVESSNVRATARK